MIFQNDKRGSFLQFAELPTRTACELELALYLKGEVDTDDRTLLEQQGWHIRHSLDVAATPETYRTYVQTSRGEFSCAKPSYVRFQNAWVSRPNAVLSRFGQAGGGAAHGPELVPSQRSKACSASPPSRKQPKR